MLGAFYPFMRNHNSDTSISQEFYRWALTTQAAQNVLDIRYRLLDYFYTVFYEASLQGAPVVSPLWFKYPKDTAIYPIDLQWFFGGSILVLPIFLSSHSTNHTIYIILTILSENLDPRTRQIVPAHSVKARGDPFRLPNQNGQTSLSLRYGLCSG
ncbi:glycosyl hydrolases family 31-domain-containing protein [Mycena olivaceomarginata]|nr:glycosyl hydrolases family 31-domain-containing protein [Mycena olivaceomarginata]